MFFDIGANRGRWALANVDKCEKIISVEASPHTFQLLSQGCKHDKIVPLNYAVCNNNGKDVTFYHAEWDVISTLNKDWLTSQTSRFNNEKYHRCSWWSRFYRN
jgi:FkbM family methyltransferase